MSNSDIQDDKVKKFMEQYYPRLINNKELGINMYKKWVLQQDPYKKDYPNKMISELGSGDRAELNVVFVSIKKDKYLACTVCKKKTCEHMGEKVEMWKYSMMVGDVSGEIRAVRFSDHEINDIHEGDEAIIKGYVKTKQQTTGQQKLNTDFLVDNIEIVGIPIGVKRVLNFLKSAGWADKKVVETMVGNENLIWHDIESFVIVDGGKVKIKESDKR